MEYTKITEHNIDDIQNILGDSSRIFFGDNIKEEYSHDELGGTHAYPDVAVIVKTTDEVSKLMAYADKNNIPVTARGSGTGLVGACVPICGGITLDLSQMNRILELDEENLTITVEPGILLMELAAYVEEQGFFYPPDPGEKTATIGGNISTNAGGMRAVKYGVTRDYVRALKVVLANGKVIELGGKVVKNSSGYDLKDLIIGSEGTLGIITECTLKLLPLPQKTVSLLIPFNTLDEAISTVPKIIKAKAIPTAIEFAQREVINDSENYLGMSFPDNQGDAYLILKFDGNSTAEIELMYDSVAQICLQNGAIDVLISNTEERDESIWKARGSFLEAIKNSTTYMDEVDVVVPRNKVNDFVKYCHSLEKEINIRIKSFGHAGDGNLHVYILKDDLTNEQWEERMTACMQKMYKKSHEMGGKVSGEHGIGFAKRPYLLDCEELQNADLMRGIKNVFDPKNLLNPGKIF